MNALQFSFDVDRIKKASTPQQLYDTVVGILESGDSSRVAALDGHSQKDDNFPIYLLSVQDAAIRIRATNLSRRVFLPSVPTSKDVVDYQNWCIDSQKIVADALDDGKPKIQDASPGGDDCGGNWKLVIFRHIKRWYKKVGAVGAALYALITIYKVAELIMKNLCAWFTRLR